MSDSKSNPKVVVRPRQGYHPKPKPKKNKNKAAISIPRPLKNNHHIQIRTSGTIMYFGLHAKKRYDLHSYQSIRVPTIFYGCYREKDFETLRKHRGKKYLIWGGGDVIKHGAIPKVRKIPDVVHIAQSNFIQKVLNKSKIPHVYIPFAPTIQFDGQFKPVPKGRGIYIYTSALSPNVYGACHYTKLTKQFPKIPFYITSSQKAIDAANAKGLPTRHIKCYNHDKIHEIYAKCFIGIRLVKHDGISATVQEMGLMGIKTVHNGGTPSSLNYNTYDNIVSLIEHEYKTIGQTDHQMSKKVREHLDVDILGVLSDLGL